MKAILIVDVETTGTGPNDRVVEIGAILWSVTHATSVASYSTLVDGATNPAAHINGIPEAALSEGGAEASAWGRLGPWVERADALVAHSCEFDQRFTPKGWDQGKPWICSMADIDWPHSNGGSRALVAIALAHGVGVSHAHRALTDCTLIARVLERCHDNGHDVRDLLLMAMRPKAKFRALVSYDDREKARLSGFKWEPDRKMWTRKMCIEDIGALPFQVEAMT